MRPLSHEIGNIYITGDGKKFLNLGEAKSYQSKLEGKEINEAKKFKEDIQPRSHTPKKQNS